MTDLTGRKQCVREPRLVKRRRLIIGDKFEHIILAKLDSEKQRKTNRKIEKIVHLKGNKVVQTTT